MNKRFLINVAIVIAVSSGGLRTLRADSFAAVSITDLSATGLDALAARLVNSDAVVQSVNITGLSEQMATFTNFSAGSYAIDSGLILSTGAATAAADTYYGGPSTNEGRGGDPRLTALSGYSTFDAVGLSFNFTTNLTDLTLNYAFASAEYPDSINTPSDDIMAIYLNGTNIATIPGTSAPISVNTVNAGTNSGFFGQYSENGTTPFAYGGITSLLSAAGPIISGSNKLEIIIADGGDHILDSAVLLQDFQFADPTPPANTPEPATWTMASGALAGLLIFARKRKRAFRS
jgi:hypothetical protein